MICLVLLTSVWVASCELLEVQDTEFLLQPVAGLGIRSAGVFYQVGTDRPLPLCLVPSPHSWRQADLLANMLCARIARGGARATAAWGNFTRSPQLRNVAFLDMRKIGLGTAYTPFSGLQCGGEWEGGAVRQCRRTAPRRRSAAPPLSCSLVAVQCGPGFTTPATQPDPPQYCNNLIVLIYSLVAVAAGVLGFSLAVSFSSASPLLTLPQACLVWLTERKVLGRRVAASQGERENIYTIDTRLAGRQLPAPPLAPPSPSRKTYETMSLQSGNCYENMTGSKAASYLSLAWDAPDLETQHCLSSSLVTTI